MAKHSAELESLTPQQKTSENQEERDEPERSSDEDDDESKDDEDDINLSNEDSFELQGREHESRSWHQNSVQDVSELSAIAHTEAKLGQTYDLQLQLEKRETGGGMTLRQRMKEKDQSQGTTSSRSGAKMCPLVTKGPQNDFRCVPWSFMDMITLAGKLTSLADGADKWIEKLKEITGGINLASGHIKALLMKTAGQTATAEIFKMAGFSGMTVTHRHDEVPFDRIPTKERKVPLTYGSNQARKRMLEGRK